MAHWVASGRRQQAARSRLAKSSLPVERFEGWALDLIVDALARDEHAREARRSARVLPVPRDT